jgi:lipopolysaccharide/colanic/teichoic acid biosynthesis glycosyltransferase
LRGLIAKRIFDILLSAAGLVCLSPLLLVTAVCIKLESRGPVFFRQERVGRFGKIFRIHKFRTMHDDDERAGPLVTQTNDRRITRVGRVLRKYKLDELAQLIDVLKGDMSLVGARPEVPKYVAYYPPHVKASVLALRPGITDLAAILYRQESDLLTNSSDPERDYLEKILPVKLRYYMEYTNHRSLWGDMVLILRTLKAIVV